MRYNVYYLFWVDAIVRFRRHHPNEKDWRSRLLVFNSFIHGLNLWIFYIWLRYFDVLKSSFVQIDLFPGTMVDDFLSFFIQFALPCLAINYFLIFHKHRYRRILERYKESKKHIALVYTYSIVLAALVSTVFYGITI